MRRRQILATAALLPTAGCTGPGPGGGGALDVVAELPTATLSMEPVTDDDVARKLTHHEMPDGERAVLARVVADGPTTTDWHLEPPVHASRPVLYEGTVYRLSSTVADRKPATSYSVVVDIPVRTPADGEGVQFEDLPAVDREKFAARGLDDGGFVGFGTGFTYTPDEAEQSVLVPDPQYQYVLWADGTTASWSVDGRWETELKRYRYAVEDREPAGEYGGRIRERYAFELSGLPEAERAIVREAVEAEHGYTVATDATPSPAFESLVDRFRPREEVAVHEERDPDVSGRYVVRFDGTVYWTGLRLNRDAGGSGSPDDASDVTPTAGGAAEDG